MCECETTLTYGQKGGVMNALDWYKGDQAGYDYGQPRASASSIADSKNWAATPGTVPQIGTPNATVPDRRARRGQMWQWVAIGLILLLVLIKMR